MKFSAFPEYRRAIHSYTGLPQETRKISNNLTLNLKKLEKEKPTKPKIQKEENKIRVEIQLIKKTIEKLNETKS